MSFYMSFYNLSVLDSENVRLDLTVYSSPPKPLRNRHCRDVGSFTESRSVARSIGISNNLFHQPAIYPARVEQSIATSREFSPSLNAMLKILPHELFRGG